MVHYNRLVSLLAMPKNTGAQSSQVKCARSRTMSTFGSTWASIVGLYKYRPVVSSKIPVHTGFREPEQSHSLREAFIVTHDITVPADISRGNSGSGVEGQA